MLHNAAAQAYECEGLRQTLSPAAARLVRRRDVGRIGAAPLTNMQLVLLPLPAALC